MDFNSDNREVPVTPSNHGEQCLANGKHEGIVCQCDECSYYMDCFGDDDSNVELDSGRRTVEQYEYLAELGDDIADLL